MKKICIPSYFDFLKFNIKEVIDNSQLDDLKK